MDVVKYNHFGGFKQDQPYVINDQPKIPLRGVEKKPKKEPLRVEVHESMLRILSQKPETASDDQVDNATPSISVASDSVTNFFNMTTSKAYDPDDEIYLPSTVRTSQGASAPLQTRTMPNQTPRNNQNITGYQSRLDIIKGRYIPSQQQLP